MWLRRRNGRGRNVAQFWLEITSSENLASFSTTNGGTLVYELDGAVPSIKFSTTSSFGQNVRWLDVASVADAEVAILSRSSGAFAVNANGPATRVSGASAYVRGQRGGTSLSRRIYRSDGVALNNVTSPEVSTGGESNSIYAWRSLRSTGTTHEMRAWADGGSRPASPSESGTNATLASGFVGFGRPGDGDSSIIWVSKIAVGTGGDLPPTGPVAGRARSRLILTPW